MCCDHALQPCALTNEIPSDWTFRGRDYMYGLLYGYM
jgi:hypothetical protein